MKTFHLHHHHQSQQLGPLLALMAITANKKIGYLWENEITFDSFPPLILDGGDGGYYVNYTASR